MASMRPAEATPPSFSPSAIRKSSLSLLLPPHRRGRAAAPDKRYGPSPTSRCRASAHSASAMVSGNTTPKL